MERLIFGQSQQVGRLIHLPGIVDRQIQFSGFDFPDVFPMHPFGVIQGGIIEIIVQCAVGIYVFKRRRHVSIHTFVLILIRPNCYPNVFEWCFSIS